MSNKPVTRWLQQLVGLFMVLFGGGFWVWGWYARLPEEYYYRREPSILGPAFFILGIGLLVFPGYKDERIARGEDISGLAGIKLLTPRWWAIFLVAMLTGMGNYLVLWATKR